MADEVTIVVGGDTVPTGPGVPLFERGDAEQLVGGELLDVIHGADFAVFNLEAPLADCTDPIAKCGPNLIAPTKTMVGLAAINPHAFALANNHILDQGAQGLDSTLQVLCEAGRPYFGAGSTLSEASEPLVWEGGGLRVGFYACAEHEFTIAGEDSPGANPFDPLETPDHIESLREKCDFVVVLYHGGKEHYRYPSPRLRKTCRKLAEKGADIVVCQHSHCIGCQERWGASTIVYGQGNFLFDRSDSEFWQTSLLLRLRVSREGYAVDFLPLRKEGLGVRLAIGADASEILADFDRRSAEILVPGFVENAYHDFASQMIAGYLFAFLPGILRLPFRFVNRLSGRRLLDRLTNRKSALAQRCFIECEAHSELFLEGLKGAHDAK